jgi:hypothetical protein
MLKNPALDAFMEKPRYLRAKRPNVPSSASPAEE